MDRRLSGTGVGGVELEGDNRWQCGGRWQGTVQEWREALGTGRALEKVGLPSLSRTLHLSILTHVVLETSRTF